jgi:ABC-2 type transport system ATP-binding protein
VSEQPVYRVEHLRKRFAGSRGYANDGIDLEVHRGEIFALLGVNGAGKTTLVRQLMSLLRPTSGRILLHGEDLSRHSESVSRTVSYLPQKTYAFTNLTVRHAIYFTGRLRGLDRATARESTHELMREWGLREIAGRVVARLSGGQQRLLGLAIALIGDLPVMLLDEPTNDLDPLFRRQVWACIDELRRRRKTTILLVTHNIHEAEQVSDRVAILRDGRVAAVGSPGELRMRYAGRVRLQLTLKQPFAADPLELLSAWGEVQRQGEGFAVVVDSAGLAERIRGLLNSLHVADIVDLHIQRPTLEDLFLEIGGFLEQPAAAQA